MASKELDLRVWPGEVPFEEAIGPRARYHPNQAAAVREKILRRVGERPVTVLGSGEMGVAYGLPSGKVLKVTHDPTEVKALWLLRNVVHPNLAQVFDAFYAVDDPGAARPVGAGVVVRESVDGTIGDLGPEEVGLALTEAVIQAAGKAQGDLCRGMDAFLEELALERVDLMFHRMILREVAAGVRELRALGICSVDFGPSNVGVIDGRVVLNDVGSTEVKGADPDVV